MFLLSALFSYLLCVSVCLAFIIIMHTQVGPQGKVQLQEQTQIPHPTPHLLTSPPPDYHAQNEKYPSFNAEYSRHTITGLIILFYY